MLITIIFHRIKEKKINCRNLMCITNCIWTTSSERIQWLFANSDKIGYYRKKEEIVPTSYYCSHMMFQRICNSRQIQKRKAAVFESIQYCKLENFKRTLFNFFLFWPSKLLNFVVYEILVYFISLCDFDIEILINTIPSWINKWC